MVKITWLCLFISWQSYGQSSNKYDNIIPKYLKVKPLLESNNYIHDSIRRSVIFYLQIIKSNPSDYFIDSIMVSNSDSLYIHLYHLRGLKYLKEIEIKNANSEWQTNVLGNPGGSITLIYIKKKNVIRGSLYSQ